MNNQNNEMMMYDETPPLLLKRHSAEETLRTSRCAFSECFMIKDDVSHKNIVCSIV